MTTRRQQQQQRERWTGQRAVDLDEAELTRAAAGGYEPGPEGYMTGRDPRAMDRAEFEAMGHEPMSPMQAIRARCLDCCAGSPHEVRLCPATSCPSWPFRTGKNPWRAPATEAQQAARVEAGRRLAARIAADAADPSKTRQSSEETVSDGVQ